VIISHLSQRINNAGFGRRRLMGRSTKTPAHRSCGAAQPYCGRGEVTTAESPTAEKVAAKAVCFGGERGPAHTDGHPGDGGHDLAQAADLTSR
jgi:hypothetical protein